MNFHGVLADTRPLRVAHFRRMWIAQIITVMGSSLTVVAVPAQIYAITGSSAYVGLTGAFGLVPLIIFGLWGGSLADHIDKRALLLITTTGMAATSGVFWLLAVADTTNVWLLLATFSLQQAFFAVDNPTRVSILPAVVRAELMPAAMSLTYTIVMIFAIAGPMVAGVLIPVTGYSALYLADAVFICVSLIALVGLPAVPPVVGDHSSPGLRSILDGLTYLRSQPILMMSFAVDLIAMVFGMPRALFPEIAHTDFGGPTGGGFAFALLYAAVPAGAVLGGVFSGWVSRVQRQGLAVIICIVIWGTGVTVFGIAAMAATGRASLGWLWIAFGALAVAGGADMISASFRQTMVLTAVSEDVRGRLQGIFLVVVAGGPRIADVGHGAAAGFAGAAAASAGGGVLVVVCVVALSIAVPVFVRYRVVTGAQPPPPLGP